MDLAQSLSTIAGAGLGLAGFSGVMTAFMQRSLSYSGAALGAFLRASSKYRKQLPALFNPYLYWGIIAGHAANIALQFMNAIGIAPAPASGIYVAGLLWYLLHAAVQFSRILLVQPR